MLVRSWGCSRAHAYYVWGPWLDPQDGIKIKNPITTDYDSLTTFQEKI